jgi:hypothetical protein
VQGDPPAGVERELAEYAEAARRRVDAFADARIRRLRELSDRLIATAETVERRFGQAVDLKEQLDDLAAALGAAAERVAREAEREGSERPPPPTGGPTVEVHDLSHGLPPRPPRP